MAPKIPQSTSAFQAFKADLEKIRNKHRRRAILGSAYDNASFTSSRGQIVKVVKHTRVRPVGRSLLSTLALGLEVDETTGVGVQVIEEWEDDEARDLVERQVEMRRLRKKEEEEEREAVEDEEVMMASGLTPKKEAKGKVQKRGRKLVKGKKKEGAGYEATVDAMDLGQTVPSSVKPPVEWSKEYDDDLVNTLERNPGAEMKAKVEQGSDCRGTIG